MARPPKKAKGKKALKKTTAKETGHIVSHTHWDRECRWPLWETRMLLLDALGLVIDTLEKDPDYRHFVLDGQTLAVEDYLEFRPEDLPRVKKLVKAGRLLIGPWYSLPEQSPIDGESLVRNLLWGHRSAEKYGKVMKVGYTTFGWGQPAQMPQIYAGFGCDVIIAGKYLSNERCPESEFLWQSPDGTKVLATKLGEYKRQNFYFYTAIPVGHGVPGLEEAYKFSWPDAGFAVRRADETGFFKEYQRIESTMRYRPEAVEKAIEDVWRTTDATVMKSDRFLGDGCDLTSAIWFIPKLIEDANKIFSDRQLVHSSVPAFAEAMKKNIDRSKLRVIEGELRDGPNTTATCNALATRQWLKILNRRAEDSLAGRAEPMAVAAWMLGIEYPRRFTDAAWKYLLDSHSHDAINGVGHDKTADDIKHRLAQAVELADVVSERSLTEIARRIDLSKYAHEDVLLVIFNPLPRSRREVVKVWLDTPKEQEVRSFHIEDASGKQMAMQHIRSELLNVCVHEMNARPWPFYVDRHNFYLDTGDVPACGYKVFRLVQRDRLCRWKVAFPEPLKEYGTMKTAPNAMANEFVSVTFRSDGSFDLKDKKSRRVFEGLNYFEDTGEVGNFWIHEAPDHNQTITSIGCPARIWTEHEGPLSTTMVSEVTMMIPARADYSQSKRSEELCSLIIRTEVTLRRGQKRVDIRTTFENRARDHRLRAMFPTAIAATHSDAAGHFHVDHRPIANETDNEGGYWPEMKALPHQSFVDVSDGKVGLALLNRGLTEYEVLDNPERTLALTLIRSMPNTIATALHVSSELPLQEGAQCLGQHEIHYSVYPHQGNWDKGGVFAQAEEFSIAPMLIQCCAHKGKEPTSASLFSVEPGDLVLSALKQAEDRKSIIVRLYNPTPRTINGKIRFGGRIKSARLVNLNEEPIKGIPVTAGHAVALAVAKHKIITVEVVPASAK